MAFDAHTHLDFPAFDADRDAVFARARAAGVTGALIAGADPQHWQRIAAIAAALGQPYALGIHPWWVPKLPEQAVTEALTALETVEGLAALGETGLDHVRARDPHARELQRNAFRSQVQLARRRNLPLVLHIVKATTEALRIVRHNGMPEAGGMIHRWSGKPPQIATAVNLGLHISFGPAILGKRASVQWEALKRTPRELLLFETDCPDQPLEGRDRGEPADLMAVIAKAATILRCDPDELAEQTEANARRLFGLS